MGRLLVVLEKDLDEWGVFPVPLGLLSLSLVVLGDSEAYTLRFWRCWSRCDIN